MVNLETAADEAMLAEQVRQAFKARTSLEIVGGGTKLAFGRPVEAQNQLSVSGLSGADEDVGRFIPTQLGNTTSGSFASYLDLSTLGIATGEDIGSMHLQQ